jgi:Ca-activated chloride channel family protein
MTEQMIVKLKADAELIAREVPTSRVIEIVITAPPASASHKSPALNLGLVLDRSGSMGGEKLEQAKKALKQIVEMLREKDRVSIVTFDDQIVTLANGVIIDPDSRTRLVEQVQSIHAGGSTNLAEGWLTGCGCVADGLDPKGVNRAILVSDGQANVGITDPEEIFQHAAAIFERGVTTSTFGVGHGFNEHLLEGMANRGGGNFSYIESAATIESILMKEFSDLLTVTARKVEVVINLPAGVSAELLGEWKTEKTLRKISVSLSDLPANRTTNLFIRLLTPPGEGQLLVNAVVNYLSETSEVRTVIEECTLQYATHEKAVASKKDQDLLRRYSAVAVGETMNEALKLERAGKSKAAQGLLQQSLVEFSDILPAPTRQRYEEVARRMDRGLEENERKNLNMDSYNLKKHRHFDQSAPEDNK